MRKLIPLLIITLSFLSCKEKVIELEKLQDRNGILYEINASNPYSGCTVAYYENGQIRIDGKMEDGLLNGKYTIYRKNGKIWEQGEMKNGKHTGISKFYDEKGNISMEQEFKDDKMDGIYKSYYENGKIHIEATYSIDKILHSKEYDINGN